MSLSSSLNQDPGRNISPYHSLNDLIDAKATEKKLSPLLLNAYSVSLLLFARLSIDNAEVLGDIADILAADSILYYPNMIIYPND
ncbi:MAG: hypothetical protein Q7S61_05880 [bacterium]|nr:hypothetical protein [bacterium]